MTATRIMPIVEVCTGKLALLGESRSSKPVYSGIRKSPVLGGTAIFLGLEGLDGDEQSDHRLPNGQRIHGGPDKAVYFYPRAHYTSWVEENNAVLVPGDFGENVTVDDFVEDRVFIGDRFTWGEAVLEVTGPRRPCAKLNMLRGPNTAKRMMATGRSGWYCKVITPGTVPTRGELRLISRQPDTLSIADAFRQKVRREPTVPGLREDIAEEA